MPGHGIPHRIETERLVLRCWTEADAPLLRDAVDHSLDHLRAWMPWAMKEPSSMDETRERLRGYEAAFDAGEDFVFGLFTRDESEVVGGSGLHPRIGPAGLEIGYWIRAGRTGRGFATEAARALTEIGLRATGVERIQIMCDPANAASRRIPEKLGYTLVETRIGDTLTPGGEPRDTLVFELRADRSREGEVAERPDAGIGGPPLTVGEGWEMDRTDPRTRKVDPRWTHPPDQVLRYVWCPAARRPTLPR